jgi:transposase
VYKCKDYIAEVDGRLYRLIVVHSSKLDKRKASKLERDLSRQKAERDEKIAELGAVEFECELDAQAALNRLRQECSGSLYGISGNVEAGEVVLRRARRGRPRKEEEFPTKTVWRVKASVGPLNEEAYEHARQRASCFVLMTNIHYAKEYPADKVLREYKEQSCVELSFEATKEPEFVGAMYVKKPERLEALAYVILLSALVSVVMQRRARRYAEATGEPLPIPGKNEHQDSHRIPLHGIERSAP